MIMDNVDVCLGHSFSSSSREYSSSDNERELVPMKGDLLMSRHMFDLIQTDFDET